jgi:hypothetical protein
MDDFQAAFWSLFLQFVGIIVGNRDISASFPDEIFSSLEK